MHIYMHIYIFKRFYLFIFRRGKGEREGEKHQSVVASHSPPTGNQTSDPLVHRLALNPLSHTSQSKYVYKFFKKKDKNAF